MILRLSDLMTSLLRRLGYRRSDRLVPMPRDKRTTRLLWMTTCAAAATLPAMLLLGGCESLGDGMGGLTSAFKQTTPSEAARWAVDPTDADKRREGIIMLNNAPFGGVDIYVRLYRDAVVNERDPIAKAAAIQALGRHGEPADALRIVPHLTHENDQVRWAAARALQRLHNPSAVPDILKSLANDQENRDVRVALAIALGQYTEDRVFHGLVGALNARELAINEAARQSLETLTGMSFDLIAADWLEWYSDAIATNSAFHQQQPYLYPTYQRDIQWYEKIVFWNQKTFEKPAPPAGLLPEGGRRTYEDAATSNEGG